MKNGKTLTLTREEWLETAESVQEMFGMLIEALKRNGVSEADVNELTTDAICALTAMRYVAEYASDKCVFAAINREDAANV